MEESPAKSEAICLPTTQGDYSSYLHQLKASTEEGLVASARKILNAAGICGFFIFELGYPASILNCIGTLPSPLIQGMEKNGFQNADQVLRSLLATPFTLPEPVFRSVIDEYLAAAPYATKSMTRHNQFVAYLKNSFCIRDIYYHPFAHPKIERHAVFCLYELGGAPEDFRRAVQSFLPRLDPLIKAFCDRAAPKTLAKMRHTSPSPMPIEVIRLMAEKDLTGEQIASVLDTHKITAYKHVSAAKQALGVSTIAGLVLQAIHSGYISLDDA